MKAARFEIRALRIPSVEDRGVPLHKMAVGVEEIDLWVTGGGVGFNDDFERVSVRKIFSKAGGAEFFEGAAEAWDAEGDVRFKDLHGGGRMPDGVGHTNDVQFLAICELEPRAREVEFGARQFRKSEEATVKGARLFDVAHGELHVVEGGLGHLS